MAKYELKRLSKDAIPAALEKVERYRLLNEPGEAESICLDILTVDAENQAALIGLLLCLTDQFERDDSARGEKRAREILPRLRDEYDRNYYAGLISERRAKVLLRSAGARVAGQAYDGFVEAMSRYAAAEAIRPPGNDDAILRWNACARILMKHPEIARSSDEKAEPYFD